MLRKMPVPANGWQVSPRHRKPMLEAFLLLALLAVLVACAPQVPQEKPGEAPAKQGGTPAPVAAKEPKRGGVIRWALANPAGGWDPHRYTQIGTRQAVAGMIYQPLLKLPTGPTADPSKLEVQPKLAEKWEQPDPTTYVFRLRKDVKWHDGQPFTAEDVKFSYDRLMDVKNAFAGRGSVAPVQEVQVVDPYTVKVITKEPTNALLSNLANYDTLIVPKHVFEKDDKALDNAWVGTGPFKVKEYVKNVKLVGERYDGYYEKGRPYLDGYELYYIGDESKRIAAFVAGQIDLWGASDKLQFNQVVQAVPGAVTESFLASPTNKFRFNVRRKPFDDVRVRKAIHLTLDRQAIMDRVGFGDGRLDSHLAAWRPEAISQEELKKLPGYRQPKGPDIAEAKKLLAEAGLASGFKTTGKAIATYSTSPRILEIVQAQLIVLGIDMEAQKLDQGAVEKAQSAFDFDIIVNAYGTPFDIDPELSALYQTNGSRNYGGYSDPKVDELILAQRGEFDKAKRAKILRELQDRLLELVLDAPLTTFVYYGAWLPHVKGYRAAFQGGLNPYLYHQSDEVWLDK